MCYRERLHPWCVVQLLPNMERAIVARFRRRGNAEEHLKILRRMLPSTTYIILFDPGLD